MESLLNFLAQFDSRTSAFLVVIAFFIQAAAIGGQALLIREYKGVRTALLGNLSLAIGFALYLGRGVLPDFLTIVVANMLTIGGQVFFTFPLPGSWGKSIATPS